MKRKTMVDYVKEVPQLLAKNVESASELVNPLINYVEGKEIKDILLIASGSSYNACHCARSFMMKHLGINVKVISPFTFTNYESNLSQHTLTLVITQSGLSTNAIEALKKLKSMNVSAICLTGNPESDVKDYADLVIDYGVGEELVGYVTKGVTALCLFLMLFATVYSNQPQLLDSIKLTAKLNEQMLEKSQAFIKKHYKHFTSMHQCYFCGSYANYGTVLEGALKIGETVHIPANAYEVEEYIHGPNLQLTPAYTVIILDNNDHTSQRVHQIYQATRAVTDHCFMLSMNANYSEDDYVLAIDDSIESELLPLVYLPFIQLLSHEVSTDLKSVFQHPLLKTFKSIADAKTSNYVNYDGDE